ncbi:CHAD domain-containing protein [Chitinophagaceae bacterium 26-R-25]|nr:CHAD domain-containing protein [Chitinophagaceae bacterium 26-R-25]
MKKKTIEESIEKRCEKINKLQGKLADKFDMKDIHELRLQVKKIRATFRLLNENDHQEKIRLPRRLKDLYNSVGMIRNIQLLRDKISKEASNPNDAIVLATLTQLHFDEDGWKEKADKYALGRKVIKTKKVLKHITTVVDEKTVKKFARKKLSEMQSQGSIDFSDNALHSVRKILKDFTYTWPQIEKNATSAMPIALRTQDKIKSLTEMLGDFQDTRVFLDILHVGTRIEQPTQNGSAAMENFKYNLFQQKRKLKKQIQNRLNHINLQAATRNN